MWVLKWYLVATKYYLSTTKYYLSTHMWLSLWELGGKDEEEQQMKYYLGKNYKDY